ncbi:MAG TPA: hypothetical protein VFM93_07870 [Candidatus Limnocylindria bacterium]|nr:hypothetical protein [Candidatus Limnocylindria bacterium]
MTFRAILVALVVFASAFAIVAAPAAEVAAAPGDGVVKGKITDAVTGTPLENVCVINGPVAAVCWTHSNSVGDYEVVLPGIPSGYATNLQFFRSGYTSASRDVVVNPNTTQTLDVQMQPTSPGQPPPSVAPPCSPCLGNPPPAAPPPPTFRVYLPNVTRMLGGRYGWHTPFIVQNVGTANTQLRVEYFKFSDGSLVATRNAPVLPGRSFVGSPNDEGDLPADTQFSVVVTSVGSPVVAVVNEHQGGPGVTPEALSYSGLSAGSTKVSLPLVSKMAGGWLTTMIMQNLGTATTTVTATFKRLDQAGTATITRVVQPGRSQFIDPRVEPSLVDGAEYAVTMTAPEPFAVVANAHNDLPGSPAPMGDSFNGVPSVTQTISYSPYVAKNADGVNRSSRVVIQNAGTTAAQPSITLTRYGGGTPTTVTTPTIEAGSSWSFVPTVADGEYSMVVGGGTFATLTTTISPLTAMFYTGTSTLANKLYMPNVTRVLTQDPVADPGWTTPIIIQSADATSATLRWFRFSDGSLVTNQVVTLTPGQATRVDPRSVTGLTNNTQYAVVLESTQQVVAIVTELNLSAGDNAMIYKAFLQP